MPKQPIRRTSCFQFLKYAEPARDVPLRSVGIVLEHERPERRGDRRRRCTADVGSIGRDRAAARWILSHGKAAAASNNFYARRRAPELLSGTLIRATP